MKRRNSRCARWRRWCDVAWAVTARGWLGRAAVQGASCDDPFLPVATTMDSLRRFASDPLQSVKVPITNLRQLKKIFKFTSCNCGIFFPFCFSSPSFSRLLLRTELLVDVFRSYWWLPRRMENQRDKRDNGSPGDSWLFVLGIADDELLRHLSNDKCCLALLNVKRSWLLRATEIRLVLRSLRLSSSSLYDEMSSLSWSSDGHQLSSELIVLRADGVCSSFLCGLFGGCERLMGDVLLVIKWLLLMMLFRLRICGL